MRLRSIHRSISGLLSFLCLVMLLSSCNRPNHGTQTELGFRDDTTGIEYVACSVIAVKPLAMSEDVYCEADGVPYYTVNFEEPSRFLCDLDAASGSSIVYRNRDLPDITIENFNAIAAFLYLDGLTPVLVAQLFADDEYLAEELQGLNPSQDTALVRQITDALVNGTERIVSPDDYSDDNLYYFRLLSADYPGLYYSVCFFGDIYGRYYVQDLATFRVADAPSEITAWIVGSGEDAI